MSSSYTINLDNIIKVEPYWNVNREQIEEEAFTKTIKVEPYWNVNI